MAHGDRSVDVFVRKLRQKLRAISPSWSYIHTHFGVGYRFAPEFEAHRLDETHSVRPALEGARAARALPALSR
jgi:DNA-binding winged helix-turn-helix (wHTH) protein